MEASGFCSYSVCNSFRESERAHVESIQQLEICGRNTNLAASANKLQQQEQDHFNNILRVDDVSIIYWKRFVRC